MAPKREFSEIGHSGGKFTVEIRTGEDGKRQFGLGIHSSSPNPQSIVGVQTNFDGQILGMSMLGWQSLSQPDTPKAIDSFTVLVASDREGLFGHQCRRCGAYWRADSFPAMWRATCVACGMRGPAQAFLTDGQLLFVQTILKQILDAAENKPDGIYMIDMDAIADEVQRGKERPAFYHAEKSQQCRYTCERCGSRNDILGKFGYCSCCGYRNNLQLLRSDFQAVMANLKAEDAENSVKLLVSSFDSCSRNYLLSLTKRTPLTPERRKLCDRMLFHNADRVPEVVRAYFDIRLLKNINQSDKRFLVRMFHRRHVFEHCGGVADEQYIRESGDTSVVPGQAIREEIANVERLSKLLIGMAANFDDGFHSIFPPESKAIETLGRKRAD